MRIGSYVSRIAFGIFTRKTLERAAFMVIMSAQVFWSRAFVAFRVLRSLSEVQVEKIWDCINFWWEQKET
jgi:hypothetical protein